MLLPPKQLKTVLFALIIALALGIRLWGIGWGMPNQYHYFSFHTDETLMITKSIPDFGGLNIFAGNFLPHYYNYGSLPFYEINFVETLAGGYHYVKPILQNGNLATLNYVMFGRALLVARLLSVFFGVGTVWATYALGRKLFNDWVGLVGAAFLAVMPLHAQQSHYATVDIGFAFWQTMSMVYAAKVFAPSKWTLKYSILAGVIAGLTAATKYSGALVIVCVLLALFLKAKGGSIERPTAIKLGLASIGSMILAFVIACPGCILEFGMRHDQFLYGVLFESDHVMHHGESYFQNTGPGWIYIIARNLDAGMGLPLLVASLIGVIAACVRRKPGDGILAIFALPVYILIGAAQSRYARYDIPFLPILAIWAARWIVELATTTQATEEAPPKHSPLPAIVIGFGLLAFTTFDTYNLLLPMSQPDPRDLAAEWIAAHQPPNAVIATSGDPWFYTASVDPYFAWYSMNGWKGWPGQSQIISNLCYNPSKWLDPASIGACKAPTTIVTEMQYIDPLRLGDPDAKTYFNDLVAQYGQPIVFQSHHPFGGKTELDGLPTQDLPIDMLYPDPVVLVYAKH